MTIPPAHNEEEEQENKGFKDFAVFSVLIWALVILTANYLGIFKTAVDSTYPASLVSGMMGYITGVNMANKKKSDSKIKEPPTPKS